MIVMCDHRKTPGSILQGARAMQAMLCDTCGMPIHGEVTEHQIVSGTVAIADEGKPRIAWRGQAQWLFLCGSCSDWVGDAIRTLRQALCASDR